MPRIELPLKVARFVRRRVDGGLSHDVVAKDFVGVSSQFAHAVTPLSMPAVHAAYKLISPVFPLREGMDVLHNNPDIHLKRFVLGNIVLHGVLSDLKFSSEKRKAVLEVLNHLFSLNNEAAINCVRSGGLSSADLTDLSNHLVSFSRAFEKYTKKKDGAHECLNNTVNGIASSLDLLSMRLVALKLR